MKTYTDYLASRGYQRVTVERTTPRPGHLVLDRIDQPIRRVEARAR